MDREEMSNEENYAFDVAGYLHVPGVLSRGEVEALNRALDEAGAPEGMLGWEVHPARSVSGFAGASATGVVFESDYRTWVPAGSGAPVVGQPGRGGRAGAGWRR